MDIAQSDLSLLLQGEPDGNAFGVVPPPLLDPVISEDPVMSAEKLFLYLEALLNSQIHADGSPRVIGTSPHVPVRLPERK